MSNVQPAAFVPTIDMSLLQLPSRSSNVFSKTLLPVDGQAVTDGVVTLRAEVSLQAAPVKSLSSVLSSISAFLQLSSADVGLRSISETCRLVIAANPALARDIHDKVRVELDRYARRISTGMKEGIPGDGWLQEVVNAEAQWTSLTTILASVLAYADTPALRNSLDLMPLSTVAHDTFRDQVLKHSILDVRITKEILAAVSGVRSGLNQLSTAVIRTATAMLSRYSTFEALEPLLLDQSFQYYCDFFAQRVLAVTAGESSAGDYIRGAASAIERELLVDRSTLPTFMWKGLCATVEAAFKSTSLSDMTQLIANDIVKRRDSALFVDSSAFFLQIGEFNLLSSSLADAIQRHLTDVISNPDNDHMMMNAVLDLKRFLDTTTCTFFNGRSPEPGNTAHQHNLAELLRSAFRNAIGSRQNAPAECIAKYLDTVMRQGQGSQTEVEFGSLLDEIIALVSFTKDKDVFKAFYSSALAKRLLLNKSASDDLEHSMISKLQKEMGDEFTTGETMMKDLQLSESLNKAFQVAKSKAAQTMQDPSHVTVNVLTESAWPSYPQLAKGWNLHLTPQLQQSLDIFTSWYGTQHKNRKLSWRHQLATVTLSARFPGGKYEINVSLFQALVLLQFNDEETLSVEDLQSRTGIEITELARTVQSLALGKKGTRVLMKRPSGKDVNANDRISYNKNFVGDKVRFRINQLQHDISAEESKQTNIQVLVDRTAILDAYVVKIMKGHKRMSLQLLVDAVIAAVHKLFPPDVKDIKKRVEDLIEREYLERDDTDKNVLKYLA